MKPRHKNSLNIENDKKDSAFIANKQSQEIYMKLGDSAKIGKNLAQMAIIQSELGDFIGSDNTAIQALKYLDKENLEYRASVYNCIAISAKKRKDYKEAIYWYKKAIEIDNNYCIYICIYIYLYIYIYVMILL